MKTGKVKDKLKSKANSKGANPARGVHSDNNNAIPVRTEMDQNGLNKKGGNVPSGSSKAMKDAKQKSATNNNLDAYDQLYNKMVENRKARGESVDDLHQSNNNDDEFFHVTCHIDQTTHSKIARGEFIDLEKLLPKDSYGVGMATNGVNTDSRVELVSRDGHTYFKPVKESNYRLAKMGAGL